MLGRSLLLTAPLQMQWFEAELPAPRADEVLVETCAGAISMGSELAQYRGTVRRAVSPPYPMMTGYESVGTIIACGSGVQHLQVGQRVVGFYGHRTHAVIPAAKAIPVPAAIDDWVALLVILSCDVAKGIQKVHPWIGGSVLVSGAGTIGLLVVWTLRALGLHTVDVIEPRPSRRLLAEQLGARQVLAPQDASSLEESYAIAFACSSRNDGFALLQARMQQNGQICVLADANAEPLTLPPHFHEKELHLVGSSDGWDYQAHARWYFDTVRDHQQDFARLFDLHIRAEDLPATFAGLATGVLMATKVFVAYQPGAVRPLGSSLIGR